MQTADLYLLTGLKRKCAVELASNHLSLENLFDFLKIARLYDLKKLEFSCISFLAENLLEVIILTKIIKTKQIQKVTKSKTLFG